LRDLWELTDLSAEAFADEVAGFFGFPRLNLPQLLAASPLAARFSRRFLREMTVFPCRIGDANSQSEVERKGGYVFRLCALANCEVEAGDVRAAFFDDWVYWNEM
jgi:hypothetical protein